jgi:electron transport complex protein RnfA
MSDTLAHIGLLFVGAAIVNNFVLVEFLGLCPFMGVSRRLDSAIGTGLATSFVLTTAAFVSYLVEHFVLIPLGAQALRTLSFILVIACVVQFTEIAIRRRSPLLHGIIGLYLPLITTNCAVLGVALLTSQQDLNLVDSTVTGLGAAVGFTLVLVMFTALRERIDNSEVPARFRGASIALISAGIMSLGFLGFSGITP